MQSLSKVRQDGGTTSVNLNMKFTRKTLDTAEARWKLVDLFRTYFQRGGTQLQINVVDREELLAARADPETHRSLCVRVGGFSAYFVGLSPMLQDEIIERTTH